MPAGEKTCHGVRFYQSRHPQIRRMKRLHSPLEFGYRVWTSCWLLIDYLKSMRLPPGLRFMEVGCGWGLAGIFCAKELAAQVTSVDADPAVFPYLRLHARLNRVELNTLEMRYEKLSSRELGPVDVLVGSDICFWDEMPGQLLGVIDQALSAGVRLILIADPGRVSFERLAEHCAAAYGAHTFSMAVRRPHPLTGRILRINNPAPPR